MKEIQILNNGDTLNAIRTKINENFQLTREEIESGTADPLAKFGVNEGNETDGVADLLNIEEGTLSFKVGGEYPNLVTTSGDGVTSEIENVNPLYLQNLADGEYTVVIDGSNSNITDATFYSQLLEPENVNDGDVWFNGESSYKYNLSSANISHKYTSTHNIYGMARDFNRMVGACDRSTIVQSYDSGQTWTTYGVPTSTPNITFVGCVTRAGVFFLLANNGSIYASTDGAMWSLSAGAPSEYTYTGLKQIGDVFIGFTASRYLLINDGTGGWNLKEVGTNVIKDIVLIDNTYYAVDAGGVLFTSTDLTTWKNEGIKYTNAVCMSVYNDKLLVGTSTGQLYIDDLKGNVQTETINSQAQINVIGVLENKIVVIAGTNGLCVTTVDLKTFNQSSESTGNISFMFENFVGGQTKIFTLETLPVWESYSYIPVGELTISGGEVTYFTTYPYNTNGLHEASSSTFGLLRTAAVIDELDCNCNDAVITPANLYSLNNYRTMNTEYQLDEKVGCPYHHNLQLTCIQAGTTSNEGLNTRGLLEAGTTIEDGTVIWQVEELGTGAGGSGYNLFDTRTTDHILSFEESKGWALQGTYVYKDAIAGSRYGYPDFYNECLTQYQASNKTIDVTLIGDVTNNNGVLSNFSTANWAEITKIPNTINSFELVLKMTTSNDVTTGQSPIGNSTTNVHSPQITISAGGATTGTIRFSFPLVGATWNSIDTDFTVSANTTYYLKMVYTGTENQAYYSLTGDDDYILVGSASNTKGILWDEKTYIGLDQIVTPFLGSIDLNESYINLNGKRFWSGVNFVLTNANGHQFYDIANKSIIDEIYNSTGLAWYYGVDEENERIFLPRNDWFDQVTGNILEVGKAVEAGLPNITGSFTSGKYNNDNATSGAFYSSGTVGEKLGGGDYKRAKNYFDASLSNPIYGNSDTVQPNAIKKLLYICVGNTESQSTITDVIDVTTTENDTIPLLTGMYFDFTPNNVSWLKGGQQTNNEGIYEYTFSELVKELTTPKYNIKVIDVNNMEDGVDYSQYWKINQEELWFKTPTAVDLFPNNRMLVSKKEATDNDPTWYNLYSDGWCEQGGKTTISANPQAVNLLKNYVNVDYNILALTSDTYTGGSSRVVRGNASNKSTSSFEVYYTSTSGGSSGLETGEQIYWQTCGYAEIPDVSEYPANVNLYFKVANAVQNLELLDAGEVLESLADKISRQDCSAYIVESYVNGTSGYNLYSNGYYEEWGTIKALTTSGTVTFLKSFKNTYYNLILGDIMRTTTDTGGGTNSPICSDFTVSGFRYDKGETRHICWKASGYIA